MKKILVMLVLLGFVVYLKPTAYMTYAGWGRFYPPYKIEFMREWITKDGWVTGVTKEGKKIFIPTDSISYVEED